MFKSFVRPGMREAAGRLLVAALLFCCALPAVGGERARRPKHRPVIPPKEVTAPWWPKSGEAEGLTRAALDYVKAHEPKDGKAFKFCVVGDANNPGFHVSGKFRPMTRVFSAVIAEANKLDPDFIIQLGDQAYVGHGWEFEGVLDAYARSKAPVLTVPGNHDKQVKTGAYKKIFGTAPYTFDYCGARFAMLDRASCINQKTMDWIEETMAFEGPKVVAMHIPPWIDYYPKTSSMLSAGGIDGRGKKAEAFKALAAKLKIDIVFMGHIHCYDRHEADGVRWIITAVAHSSKRRGMNARPWGWLPRAVREERRGKTQYVPHFVEVQVKDGVVTDRPHFLPDLNKLDEGREYLPLPASGEIPEFWWRWWENCPLSAKTGACNETADARR
ncbi:MAG: metallophosphoesterase family protein [Planctomycetota bacterium]|jgi:predicted phosphodiesterase